MLKKYSVEKIHNFMQAVFTNLGVPKEDAKICADVLIESDLSGITSHGVGRLKMYYDRIKAGIQNPVTKIDTIKDKSAISLLDGKHGMGHVIAKKAMQKAIDKAKKYGISSVAVRNSTHFGIAGYYPRMAAEQDCIGLAFTNARPSVSPIFGVTPLLGTNPIAFGAPTDLPYPFLYDAATSITQRGKIEVLNRAKQKTPEEWAIDSKGKALTDTPKILQYLLERKASMVPLGGRKEETGGHKGYSLAVIVEILSAALQKGSFMQQLSGKDGDKRIPYKLGHYFIAIDIASFTEVNSFKKITGSILRKLKESEKELGQDHIYVAGEKEYLRRKKILEDGIPVTEELLKNLKIMQNDLKLYDFEFE